MGEIYCVLGTIVMGAQFISWLLFILGFKKETPLYDVHCMNRQYLVQLRQSSSPNIAALMGYGNYSISLCYLFDLNIFILTLERISR